jgi:serine/threonine protein kinase
MRFHDLAPALFDLFEAVSFLHQSGYLHRDSECSPPFFIQRRLVNDNWLLLFLRATLPSTSVKPENCFWSRDRRLLLGDFGLTRKLEKSLTPQMVTRWYRSPELLLGSTNYGEGIDVFAIGVIAAEMLTGAPLFPGDTEVDQLDLLFRFLRGPEADTDTSVGRSSDPNHPSARRRRRLLELILESKPRIVATTAAHCPPAHQKKIGPLLSSFVDLLTMLMAWNPKRRPSANSAKGHPFFAQAHSLGWL